MPHTLPLRGGNLAPVGFEKRSNKDAVMRVKKAQVHQLWAREDDFTTWSWMKTRETLKRMNRISVRAQICSRINLICKDGGSHGYPDAVY